MADKERQMPARQARTLSVLEALKSLDSVIKTLLNLAMEDDKAGIPANILRQKAESLNELRKEIESLPFIASELRKGSQMNPSDLNTLKQAAHILVQSGPEGIKLASQIKKLAETAEVEVLKEGIQDVMETVAGDLEGIESIEDKVAIVMSAFEAYAEPEAQEALEALGDQAFAIIEAELE
jgi:hypothetical protein